MHLTPRVPRGTATWLAALGAAALAVTTTAVPVASAAAGKGPSDWPMSGQNLANTADAPTTTISPANVATLQPKWTFTTGGDVTARPAVVRGVAYFPDWAGKLYAVKAGSGKKVWSRDIGSDYFGSTSAVVSTTSPALVKGTNTLYAGTQNGWLLAIDAGTGALRWRTQLDTHPFVADTASPVVLDGVVYVGASSTEGSAAAFIPGYACCSFRGSVLAVDAATGQILWKTYTAPAGYSGADVSGAVVPDRSRHLVYATTGNNYDTPTDPSYVQCVAGGGTPAACTSPDNHVDSVIALDMSTGQYVWATRSTSSDAWNESCLVAPFSNCPSPTGDGYAFVAGPQLVSYRTPSGTDTLLGAGRESGDYYALDPDTGQVAWQTQVGPGSVLGGIEGGTATDGKRIYVPIANLYGIPHGAGAAGSWTALDPATGQILWRTADPNGAIDLGPVTVANGVVYAASMAGAADAPTMLALDAATGATLWSHAAGSSVGAGPSIAGNTVFWGSGYATLGIPGFTANNKLYAFTLGGM